MNISLKKYIPPITYAIANCIPTAPIMGINILALFSKKTYTNKATIFVAAIYVAISLPFLIIHLKNGVDLDSYIQSYLGSVFVIFTSTGAAIYMSSRVNLDWHIKASSVFIFLAFIISSLSLLITGDEKILGGWYQHYYTSGLTIHRYGGYMYEASHLCLVIAPLFFYFISNLKTNKNNIGYVLILIPPLIATYSAGFFATLIATIAIASIAKIKSKKTMRKLIFLLTLSLLFISLAYSFSDAVKNRIDNISSFTDSSAKGRSLDSYSLAIEIAEQKSLLFGAGIGQIKIIGNPIIIDFYKYSADLVEVVRIPSSGAEMLASYGVIGFIIKIIALLFIYMKFKIYHNTYGNYLFVFFFLYQFYGSFMLSTIEIFCFALAAFISKAKSLNAPREPLFPKNTQSLSY